MTVKTGSLDPLGWTIANRLKSERDALLEQKQEWEWALTGLQEARADRDAARNIGYALNEQNADLQAENEKLRTLLDRLLERVEAWQQMEYPRGWEPSAHLPTHIQRPTAQLIQAATDTREELTNLTSSEKSNQSSQTLKGGDAYGAPCRGRSTHAAEGRDRQVRSAGSVDDEDQRHITKHAASSIHTAEYETGSPSESSAQAQLTQATVLLREARDRVQNEDWAEPLLDRIDSWLKENG